MSLGRQKDRQSDLLLTWRESPRSLCERLRDVLQTTGFDRFVEDLCKPYYASSARGRSSLLQRELHGAVFAWVLAQLAEHGLIKGARIGVDGSTMAAIATLQAIVRPDSGGCYREMLQRRAKESGIETPTADDLVRLDRKQPGQEALQR